VIVKEAFRDGAVPSAPAVFKDPLTAGTRLYVNSEGKDLLEGLVAGAGITGLEFAEPGAR
jgi:hypothetical protein